MADADIKLDGERLARIETILEVLVKNTGSIPDSVARMQERATQQSDKLTLLFSKYDELAENGVVTKEKVDKWVNRGVGAYAAAVIFAGLLGWVVVRAVNDYDGRIRNIGETIVTVERRLAWVEFDGKGRTGIDKKGEK